MQNRIAEIGLILGLMGPPYCQMSAQTIRGHLVDADNGRPIAAGLVILQTEAGDSITSHLTDQRGYFSVTSPDPGSFRVLASALGYGEATDGVFELGMGAELTVEFRIAPEPLPVDVILASVDQPTFNHALVRNGFVRRLQRNVGGVFITPRDIDESSAVSTEDLLSNIVGVTVRLGGGATSPLSDVVKFRGPTGNTCSPGMFVDGIEVDYDVEAGISISTLVPLPSVYAIEVYRGPAEIPIEYNMTRDSREDLCGVLVFWTREGA